MTDILIPRHVFGAVMALLVILAGIMAYRASHSSKSKFSLDDAFQDHTGKTSLSRIGFFVALTITSWGFVELIVDGKMTEFYFIGYIGAFVTHNLGAKFLEKKEPA